MYYLIALFGVMAVYVAALCLVPRLPRTKWVVLVFVAIVFLPYVYCSLSILRSVGFDDWNFKNTLPTANVSPFTFFLCPLCLVLPTRIGKYFMTMISLLSVGMLFSGAVTCIFNYMRDYTFYLTQGETPVTGTLTYSVSTYCMRMLKKVEGGVEVRPVVEAMLALYEAATAYKPEA